MTYVLQAARTLALLWLSLPPLQAQVVAIDRPPAPVGAESPPRAGLEDYRVPVGRLEGGVLRVTLEAQTVAWHPWGEAAPAVAAHAFGVDGAAPRVPGPLIRVSAGTPVQVTLRNTLDKTLVVRGLRDRGHPVAPGPALFAEFRGDSVMIAPDGSAEVRFTPTTPGTFMYYGRVLRPGDQVTPPILPSGDREDGPFLGVLLVDPVGVSPPPEERIFLMTQWMDKRIRDSWDPSLQMMINGRSWPATERLTYTEGDTVRWRVINATGVEHPMHLHGFFFRVDARGDQRGETEFGPAERRLAVTETLGSGETMRLTWVPEEPGNWIYHCHLMRHMSGVQAPPSGAEVASHHAADAAGHDLMAGLVLGITVRPGPEATSAPEPERHRLALHVTRRPGVFGTEPAYGFVLQQGEMPPAADSVRFPGSPIVLTRGEPAEIVVRNRADVPLGVHWHGLELESWADGVPGWSGYPGAIRPPVAPGDSFVVRMTPPRAGSFMYHVHSEPGHQLAQGLYGAFLVLEPGKQWDPETDRVLLLGSLGAEQNAPPAVNGAVDPAPIELRAGTTYRLRFMHISPDDQKRVQLLAGERPVEWRMVAKDGADLPPAQVRSIPADLRIRVGETYDFRWTPTEPGERTLRIETTFERGAPAFPLQAPPPHTMEIPVRVR